MTVSRPVAGWGAPAARFRRILSTTLGYLVTVAVLVVLSFLLPRVLPGDPLTALQDKDHIPDAATLAREKKYYGLDKPLAAQFGHYLAELGRGDLGTSIQDSRPVLTEIGERLPWTLLLVLTALAIASIAGAAGGIHSAWRRGELSDSVMMTLFLGLDNVPSFVVGYLLLLVFAVILGWLPLAGSQTAFATMSTFGHVGDVLSHLMLPAITLALSMVGGHYLLMRNTMASELGQGYLLLGRAKGLSPRRLKYRYAARNALLPVVTQTGVQLGFLVSSSVLIETVFAYPGLGQLTQHAVAYRDYPLITGTAIVFTLSVLLANLAVDLLYGRLDPRTRDR